MIKIDNILINENVTETSFSCDLKNCKGACCTIEGEIGAPLKTTELPVISNILKEVLPYLSERSQSIIKDKGFYIKKNGEYSTQSIDNKDCVFVFYESDIAKCAIERAYFDEKVDFRKPISCHLFPVREGQFGGKYLYYEKFDECEPGQKLGKEKKISLVKSLENSLSREYGESFYQKINHYTENKNKEFKKGDS